MERKYKEIKFRAWEETRKDNDSFLMWKYSHAKMPIGQEWGVDDGFVTNGRGEGFQIHRGTKFDVQCQMVDALNKRDAEIEKLIRGLYTVTGTKDRRS